ncbi:hypothetical protein J6590_093466 [Homalodisca vitripennis]|nr:hypothetical protein J6590_093466 [Homalodisca vitripennis]
MLRRTLTLYSYRKRMLLTLQMLLWVRMSCKQLTMTLYVCLVQPEIRIYYEPLIQFFYAYRPELNPADLMRKLSTAFSERNSSSCQTFRNRNLIFKRLLGETLFHSEHQTVLGIMTCVWCTLSELCCPERRSYIIGSPQTDGMTSLLNCFCESLEYLCCESLHDLGTFHRPGSEVRGRCKWPRPFIIKGISQTATQQRVSDIPVGDSDNYSVLTATLTPRLLVIMFLWVTLTIVSQEKHQHLDYFSVKKQQGRDERGACG